MNDIDIYEKPKLNKMPNFAIECLGRLYTFGVHNFSVHLFYYNPLSKKCFRGGIYTTYYCSNKKTHQPYHILIMMFANPLVFLSKN